DEVRSGGSYISQNDLRVHFGLGKAEKVDVLEIRWPSGQVDTLKNVQANQLIFVKESAGIERSLQFNNKAKSDQQHRPKFRGDSDDLEVDTNYVRTARDADSMCLVRLALATRLVISLARFQNR